MTFSWAAAGAIQKARAAATTVAINIFMGFPHVSDRSFACKDHGNFSLVFALAGGNRKQRCIRTSKI
jgi:hypothetical protein